MKDILISKLRDADTGIADFRLTAENLSWVLANEASALLEKENYEVRTPLGVSTGWRYQKQVVLVPVLRAGMALLHAFLKLFPMAPVGFVGLRRDEKTAEAHCYYTNLPSIGPNDAVMILEPMLATGGSSVKAVEAMVEAGAHPANIIFVSVVSAAPGEARLRAAFPEVKLLVAQRDSKLDEHKFIVPGLGDFGDRYFGT